MARGNFNAGPQGPPGLSTGPAGGDLGGTYPNPTLAETANVDSIVRASKLNQMSAPNAAVSLNSQKITNLANGTLATDGAAFGQIPTALPPNGAASGDLTGTYPNPTLSNTANVQAIVRSNRLDQMAVPTNAVSMNSQKLTNLANGTVATDAVNFSQIPTTLPPTGSATGDLSGTYPAPTVAKINGTTVSGTPAIGKLLTSTSGTAANWGIPGWTAGSTGVLSGGNMTPHPTILNAFNLSATTGFIADYTTNPAAPTVTYVTIPSQTITITGSNANNAVNWWVADSTGTVSSIGPVNPTDVQRRTLIQLGATGSQVPSGNIISCAPAPTVLNQPYNQLLDMAYSLGPFVIKGNHISPNGVNLSFNRSAGTAFFANFNAANNPNDPHMFTTTAGSAVPFRYSTRVSGSENGAAVTVLDPTRYDNNGVLTLVGGGSNSATIQRVFLFGLSDTTAQMVVYYGQTVYASLSAAQAAIGTTNFQENPDLENIGTLLGWIVVIRTATNLSDPTQAVFVNAGKFANP